MKQKELPRLTRQILEKAEREGMHKGWYNLMSKGYTAEEISMHLIQTTADINNAVRLYANRHRLPIPVNAAPRRMRKLSPVVLGWKDSFKQNVMRVGMTLSLTQSMLELLCATADNVQWDRSNQGFSTLAKPDNLLASAVSLERRGLIERKSKEDNRELGSGDAFFKLTEAGVCVVQLLIVTGVFIEQDNAIERKTKKA